LLIRPMGFPDVADVTALCAQLGFPSTLEQVAQRFRRISSDAQCALFVAQGPEERILGWVYVRGVLPMVSDPRAEIWSLVVDEEARGQGIGRALMERVEAWAAECGYQAVSLRSNTVRHEAHRFYERLGYRITKTSHIFEKSLDG
jgi:ribosomal protein S18 acetylase RimI-like enzyme